MTSESIARVRTRRLRVPFESARGGSGATALEVVHVTVALGHGVEGTGFTYSLTGGSESVHALLERTLAPRVVGVPVEAWDRTWHELWSLTHRLGRGVTLPALSALDIAVWDARAQAAGVPLHRLLGSRREAVPVYGSGRATHQMTVDELIEGARSYVEEGYAAVKLRAGALAPTEDVRRVAAVQDALGPDVLVMVDCNERLDEATALWLGRRFEDAGVYWMEEPLAADNVSGHARLAQRLALPLAVGEHLKGRFEFGEYMQAGAASVLQPDAPLVGGVTEWMRIATVAEVLGCSISPHFLPELHVHLAAAAQACTWIEHFPLMDDLYQESLVAVDGAMSPPDRPGHGILWDADAIERYAVAE